MQRKKIILLCAVILFAVLLGTLIPVALINSRTVRIAFYGIDGNIEDAVRENILENIQRKKSEAEESKSKSPRIKFYTLDSAAELPKNAGKKYSILITENSLALRRADTELIPAGSALLKSVPLSIARAVSKDGGHYALPLLLDHFEIAYYRTVRNNAALEIPRSYGELLNYLNAIKGRVEIPLACAGGEDKNLFGFVSALAESIYGASGYEQMIEQVRQGAALNQKEFPEMLLNILNEIKEMQEQGLLYKSWTKAIGRDIEFLMGEHQIAVTAMFLSAHRKVEFNLIKYYDSSVFPRNDLSAEHGIIAPMTAAAILKAQKKTAALAGLFADDESQRLLSNSTLLAPVAARAEAVDIQADDVRFWAASCARGPLADMGQLCETTAERRHILAEKIRSYLEY